MHKLKDRFVKKFIIIRNILKTCNLWLWYYWWKERWRFEFWMWFDLGSHVNVIDEAVKLASEVKVTILTHSNINELIKQCQPTPKQSWINYGYFLMTLTLSMCILKLYQYRMMFVCICIVRNGFHWFMDDKWFNM